MSQNSFVETLDLAHDARLGALRDPTSGLTRRDLHRGADTKERTDTLPGGISVNWRAAVNAGALISFVAGLTEAQMSDVLYSTQLAQRAANAKHDRFAATREWYGLYADVLTRLGWVGEGFAFTQRGNTSGDFTMDKSALDVIMAVATGNQLAILVKSLDTLKGLADGNGAIRVFEMQALSELSGNFQIGAAQLAENGALSLALGGFHFRTRDARRRVLFVSWGAEEIEFWTGVQKLTLNAEHYAKHRSAVAKRLAADAADYIAELEIA